MNFSTEYKNILFQITLEKENYSDISHLLGDKFNRLPNQTLIELKKGTLASYNLIIISKNLNAQQNNDEQTYTHYLSSILLTSDESELVEEISDYLDQEEIIESIVSLRDQYAISPGPHWRDR